MKRQSHGDTALVDARRLVEFRGPAALADDQLLALVLGQGADGTSPLRLSRHLLEDVGGIRGLSKVRPGALRRRPGLGARRSSRVIAAIELGRRAEREALTDPAGERLTAAGVADWAIPRLGHLDHEEVWILCVDGRTALRSAWQVGRGGVHGCALVPRDLLTPVVREAAAGFVLVHNHPSGDPTPSREDVELTRHLDAAASTLCTPLLDHVVVSRSGFRSMFEDGILPIH